MHSPLDVAVTWNFCSGQDMALSSSETFSSAVLAPLPLSFLNRALWSSLPLLLSFCSQLPARAYIHYGFCFTGSAYSIHNKIHK